MSLKRAAIFLTPVALVFIACGVFIVMDFGIFLAPDRSILTDRPCAPPCWSGIIPGQTQKDAAWNALKQNPYVKQRTLEQLGDGYTGKFFWFNRHTRGELSHVYWRENIVQIIEVESEPSLKLGDVTTIFGDPEKVLAWHEVTPEDLSKSYIIRLYYPGRGIVVTVQTLPEGANGKDAILPEMPLREITYFKPRSLEALFIFERSFFPSLSPWDQQAQNALQDWKGFSLYTFAWRPY